MVTGTTSNNELYNFKIFLIECQVFFQQEGINTCIK